MTPTEIETATAVAQWLRNHCATAVPNVHMYNVHWGAFA